jgi:hypothetical protein
MFTAVTVAKTLDGIMMLLCQFPLHAAGIRMTKVKSVITKLILRILQMN